MVPSFDPELNLVYIGISVTSPAPKFMLGGPELSHLRHNSTHALTRSPNRRRCSFPRCFGTTRTATRARRVFVS